MKKLLMAFAAAALLVGCAKEYDDSAIRKDLSDLKGEVGKLADRVSTLESNMKAIVSFPDQLIQSVQELKDEADNIYGYTVTYVTGESYTFKIDVPTNADDPAAQVIGLAKDEDGTWWWTLNGQAIYPLQVLNYIGIAEDGHLYVGGADRGLVQDAIIQSITDTAEGLVITLYSGDTFTIPKAANFALKFAQTTFGAKAGVPVEVPYTLENAPEGTVVDVWTDVTYEAVVDAEAKKITVTPSTPFVKGSILVFADSQIGYTSIKKLTFEGETFDVTDTPTEEAIAASVDYIGEATQGEVVVKGVYNIPFTLSADVDWIHAVQTKAESFEVTVTLDDNTTTAIRTGNLNFVDADKNIIKTVTIAQKAAAVAGPKIIKFDGTVFRAELPAERATATEGTLEAWVSVSSLSGCQNILGAEGNFLLRIDSNQLDYVYGAAEKSNGEFEEGHVRANIGTNEWHHVAATYVQKGKAILYIDGEKVGEADTQDHPVYMDGKIASSGNYPCWGLPFRFYIGSGCDKHNFTGNLAYARVWDKALSAEEIALVKASANVSGENLLAYWKFDEEEGNTIADYSGNNLTITAKKMFTGGASGSEPALEDAEINWLDGSLPVVSEDAVVIEKAGSVEPQPAISFDPANFAALDWSNKNASTWYYFKENYALPQGFTFILHIYPYSLNTSGMRVGNFGNNTESPCNMLRFGQNGNNAELEWMVDYNGGRSQKELLAPGFEVEKWQAIVLTADAATNTYKIYRNDVLGAEKTLSYNTEMGFGAIEFANSWGASWRSEFKGRMALLSVYDKALSAEEIKANIFGIPTSDACVGFWPMNEGEGAVLYADPARSIKENIDLSKAVRNDNDNVTQNHDFDATEYLKWTTGNKIESTEPDPEPIPTANKAPYMKSIMFGVTFPDEYAALDETSFEGWVYPKSYNGAQANLPTFMGTENAFMVRFENHKPQIVLGDPVTGGGEIKASSPTALGVNQWYHIAATYKRNDKIVLYVNGEKVAENNTKDFPVTYNSGVKEGANDDAAIGRKFWVGNAYSTRWFDGNMSHLRVWSKALTQAEIKASANNKELTTAEGLIANWPLNEAEGVAIVDVSGNNLNTVFKTYTSAVEDAASATREDANVPDLVFAESLELSEKTLKLMKGDEKVLTVSVKPDNAMVPEITWESSAADIVSVNGGTVLAKGVGSATITAKATVAGTEISATCDVTVSPLTGVVAPHMKENYFRTMGGFGDLEEVTVEWKMNAKYDNPEVSSIFGKEGSWLLRVGDAGIGRNELQLATNHGNWTTGVTFENDKWYHVAVTYKNGGAVQVYVNGELKAENTEFATAVAGLAGTDGTDVSYYGISANDDVKIGASYMERGGSWGSYYAVNNRWLDGQLCEVRVWNKVRSASEIAANMNNLEDTSSENLLAYYKMDLTDANTGNGNTIKDYSSAGKDLVADTDVRWQQGRDDIAAPAPAALSVSEFIALDDKTEATFEGIVAALASKGFVATDGKQNLYVFQNAAPTVKAGDKVSVTAKKITYYGLVETDKANVVVTVLSSGNAIPTTEVADITATLDTFPETASTSVMVKLEGTVAISGNYVNFNVEGAKKKGSLHGLDFSGENGKKLAVTGYYIGTSGSGGAYVNIAATSFEAL